MYCTSISLSSPVFRNKRPNELRIDLAERANAEAQFNAPPHQSELGYAVLGT